MKKVKNFFYDYWGTFLIVILTIIAYIYGTENGILDTFLYPKVSSIWASFEKYYKTLLMGMIYSFRLLLPGLFIGTLVAFIIGIPMGLNKRIRKTFNPIIYSISVIPAILLSPFALNSFSTFRTASLFLVCYSSIWPTLFATINGILTIDKRYLDNAATLEIKGIERLIKIIIPATMPSILSGFITSVRGAFLVLVFAEMYGSKYGMGYFVQHYSDLGIFEHVWSGFIFMVLVLVCFMQIIEKIKNRILIWTIEK